MPGFFSLCDRCNDRILSVPSWVLRPDGREDKKLCERCTSDLVENIENHPKVRWEKVLGQSE